MNSKLSQAVTKEALWLILSYLFGLVEDNFFVRNRLKIAMGNI